MRCANFQNLGVAFQSWVLSKLNEYLYIHDLQCARAIMLKIFLTKISQKNLFWYFLIWKVLIYWTQKGHGSPIEVRCAENKADKERRQKLIAEKREQSQITERQVSNSASSVKYMVDCILSQSASSNPKAVKRKQNWANLLTDMLAENWCENMPIQSRNGAYRFHKTQNTAKYSDPNFELDINTVFVYNLPQNYAEKDLHEVI